MLTSLFVVVIEQRITGRALQFALVVLFCFSFFLFSFSFFPFLSFWLSLAGYSTVWIT